MFFFLLLGEEFSGGGLRGCFYVGIGVVWIEIRGVEISGKLQMSGFFFISGVILDTFCMLYFLLTKCLVAQVSVTFFTFFSSHFINCPPIMEYALFCQKERSHVSV